MHTHSFMYPFWHLTIGRPTYDSWKPSIQQATPYCKVLTLVYLTASVKYLAPPIIVALHTSWLIPVLDNPVLLPIHIFTLIAIANHKNSMVQVLTTAVCLIVNTCGQDNRFNTKKRSCANQNKQSIWDSDCQVTSVIAPATVEPKCIVATANKMSWNQFFGHKEQNRP